MRSPPRRALAVLFCLLVLGGAAAWSELHAVRLRDAAVVRAHEAALGGSREVLAELARLEAQVQRQAASFGELRGIRALVEGVEATDPDTLGQLRNTLSDLLRNEPWADRWAKLGTIAFVVEGHLAFSRGGEGLPAGVEPLLQQARTAGGASGLVDDHGRVMLAGVARASGNTRHQGSAEVLLLAPLTSDQLALVAAQLGAGVVLRTGGAELTAGDTRHRELFLALQGDPRPASEACCAAVPVSAGAQLAVWLDPAPALEEAAAAASTHRLLAVGLAAVLAALALLLGFRAGRGADPRLLAETTAELARSREELRRLSQLIPPGAATLPLTRHSQHVPPPGATIPFARLPQLLPPEESPTVPSARTTEPWFQRGPELVPSPRYVEVGLLAEGGMARVSLAEVRGAEGFRRRIVVKRLKPEFCRNPEVVSQFIDEARLGASLVHSNIVPVFDFGRDAEGYFLAQEYIVGRDVDALVRASQARRGGWALEPELVLYLAAEVLKALAYAHARTDDAGHPLRLVHRDISPFNLMVTARGEVKLLDFGIVKGEQRITHTRVGTVKGNLCFMSPEQARAGDVDARSDLFSLGMVLFTAARGETLYEGQSTFELVRRAGAGPTPDDLRRVAALPDPLGPLVARALETDPERRFPTAEAFARAVAATGRLGTAANLQSLMEYLFREELDAESGRLLARSSA